MNLDVTDLRTLAEVAVSAARDAAQMIASSRPVSVEHKASGSSVASQVVTEIDRRSEQIIVDHLAPTLDRFELALLTEERDDDGGRLVADHFWCVDPLDGTLPFIEGAPGYAVSIALVRRDGVPLIGVVCDPIEMTTVHAVAGAGAFRDGAPWQPLDTPPGDELSMFADRSFLDHPDRDDVLAGAEAVARELGLAGVRLHTGAGAVMNACGVLRSAPGCYLKFPAPSGGGSLWDFAATACVFHELGAVATDIHGAPLDLNRPDSTLMNHRGVLFATDERLATRLRSLHTASVEADREAYRRTPETDDGWPDVEAWDRA